MPLGLAYVTSGSVSWDDCISISSSDPFGNRVKQVVPSWDAFAVLHVNGSVSVWEKSEWTGPTHSAESSEIESAHAVYSLHSGFAVIHGDSDSLAVLKSRVRVPQYNDCIYQQGGSCRVH